MTCRCRSRRTSPIAALSLVLITFVAILLESATTPASRAGSLDPGCLGVIFARESVELAAEVSGEVRRVHVELGDEVKQGQVLVSLESEELLSELERARAALQTAKARVTRWEAELTDAERLLERRREAPEIFPAEQLETLETKREMAEAEKQAALAIALEREAELAEFERRVAALEVRAPFDGAVAACHHDTGARVDAGVSLLRLITLHSLWVRFAVPSTESDWLKVGLAVQVQPERGTVVHPATIRRIAPEVDPATDMIFVEASLVVEKGERRGLRSGEAVRVRRESLQEAAAE